MKLQITTTLSAFALAAAAAAAPIDYSSLPFKMEPVAVPSIPQRTVSIADFGAAGDGHTMCTDAFKKAIDQLSAQGGGRLEVPAGVWLTGPIRLQSHIELHLADGALIQFSDNRADYPLIESTFEGVRSMRCMSPITAKDVEDIAITGRGVLDGAGQVWRPVKRSKLTQGQWEAMTKTGATNDKGGVWYPSELIRQANENPDMLAEALRTWDNAKWDGLHDFLRPALVSITGCKRVLIEDATLQNSPGWNTHPLMCQDVTLRRVSIRNPWYAQNGDGLDLESCKRCIVEDCTLDVGDDALCIKSGRDKEGRDRAMPTEQVVVRGCKVYHGHGGFVIGSEMSGGARDIVVDNCAFIGTDTGLRFKSTRGRGGVVERIYINNVAMSGIAGDAITFDLYYGGKPKPGDTIPKVDETTPRFDGICIANTNCRGAKRAIFINGLPEMPVKNITIENSTFTATTGAELNEASGVKFHKVGLFPKTGEKITIRNNVAGFVND